MFNVYFYVFSQAYEAFIVDAVTPRFLPVICSTKHKKRSQSMDGVVPVRNKICSNNYLSTSCYVEKILSTSVPLSVNANLSLYKSCDINCSFIDRSNSRKSFNSSLHSIDETELYLSNNSNDIDDVVMESQSDALIRCAFTNKGFDIEANNQRYFSQLSHKLDETIDGQKKNISQYVTVPKIKVRISDEWGQRVDNSLDSQSDSSDFDDSWNFGTAKIRNTSNQCDSDDAFKVIKIGRVVEDEVIHPIVNKCRKCGHKKLKSQFSSNFV